METDELMAWVQEMEQQEREWWAWLERGMERDTLSELLVDDLATDKKY